MTTLAIGTARFINSDDTDNVCVDGYYTKEQGGVLFLTPDRDPFAYLVNNTYNERFFVSASRGKDGRLWFMYGLSELDRVRLGLPEGYLAECDIAEATIDNLRPTRAVYLRSETRSGDAGWETDYASQHLRLLCQNSFPDELYGDIAHAVAAAGFHLPASIPGHCPLSTGDTPELVLSADAERRLSLVFVISSLPECRYHGNPKNWAASRLDHAARATDWRAGETHQADQPVTRRIQTFSMS